MIPLTNSCNGPSKAGPLIRSVSELSIHMKPAIVFLLFSLAVQLYAAENLTRQDYDGNWNSIYVAVKNEKQVLKISLSGESVFERYFENSISQILHTTEFKILDDLLVLTFTSRDKVFGYKLALSGWKSQGKKVIYGSMFMYRNGIQFNMLPVSYEQAN